MALLPTKANTAENNQTLDDRTPIPAGDVVAVMKKSEFKETKAKTGHYLAIMYRVIAGPYKGRSIFSNLNLDNPNPIAVEIANKELNSICQAVGLSAVEDSSELHDIPLTLTLRVTPGDAAYPPGNEISGYATADSNIGYDNEGDEGEHPPIKELTQNNAVKRELPWEKAKKQKAA